MDLGAPIAKGNTARIYLSDNKIVKVYENRFPQTESVAEANKQKLAYSSGLVVPQVIDVTNVQGNQAIIMEYIEGTTIGDLLFEDLDHAHTYLALSVDIQRKIHLTSPRLFEPMKDKLHRQIEAVPILDEMIKSILLQKLASMKFTNSLCHGDFHVFNLIKSVESVTIIDWADASAGDLRADVCRTYLLYEQFSPELADMYVQIYCEKSGITKEEIFEWIPIIAGARLGEGVRTENNERLLDIIHRYIG